MISLWLHKEAKGGVCWQREVRLSLPHILSSLWSKSAAQTQPAQGCLIRARKGRNGGYSWIKNINVLHQYVHVFLLCTSNQEASWWHFMASPVLVILLGIHWSCQSAVQILFLSPSRSCAAVLSFSAPSHAPGSLPWDARSFTFLLNYLNIFHFSSCACSLLDSP